MLRNDDFEVLGGSNLIARLPVIAAHAHSRIIRPMYPQGMLLVQMFFTTTSAISSWLDRDAIILAQRRRKFDGSIQQQLHHRLMLHIDKVVFAPTSDQAQQRTFGLCSAKSVKKHRRP